MCLHKLRASRKLPVLLALCMLMGGYRIAHARQHASAVTGAVGLTLVQDPSAHGNHNALLLKLRNNSEKPIALALGVEKNGGRGGINLSALSFEIINSHGARSIWQPLFAGVISGRLDPFVVLLVPRAELTLPISLSDSEMMSSQNPGVQLLPKGPLILKAKLTCSVPKFDNLSSDIRGIASMPFWSGVTYSLPLRLPARTKRR